MTTQTPTATTPNYGQYFRAPAPTTGQPPQQPQQTPGFLSRLGSGIQHYVYAPARHATEQAVQGASNQFSTLFTEHQDEITHRVRDVFTTALLRRCPEKYPRLIGLIRAFLNNPSQADLDEIKQLLNGLTSGELRTLDPNILDQGVNALTTLKVLLDTEVTTNLPPSSGASPVLTVSNTAKDRLQIAEFILLGILKNNEGVVIQTINDLTHHINDPQGPLYALRHQLNGRAHPPLRQCKEALETYRNALGRNGAADELHILMPNLREKLQRLLADRAFVPQMQTHQWTQLEQFEQQLQGVLANPTALPAHGQLQTQTDPPLQILTAVFAAQRGIIEETTDIFMEGIGRGMATLPSMIYQGFNAAQQPTPAAPQPPVPSPTPTQSATAGPLNLNSILTQGRRLLDSILSSAGTALAQQGARSLSTMVHYVFEKIRDHIQTTPEQQHLLETINPMIQRLHGAAERSSFQELTGVLQEAFRFMQEQQVYLQSWRLPLNPVRSHVSSIPDFLQNINAHNNALQQASLRAPQNITDEDIEQKTELIKIRASSSAGKFFLELIGGVEKCNIYKASDINDKDPGAMFRERIFEKIDQSPSGGFFKPIANWLSKRAYDCIVFVSSFFVNSFFDNIFNNLKNGIQNDSTPQESRENLFVRLARNWLAVTSGAYNQVASAPPSKAKDFRLMMEEAIKSPDLNGGLSQSELFAAVAKTAIDAFGPRIKWNETVDRYFQAQIPEDSPLQFLNPLASALNRFCSFCLKALFFIPQSIGNFFLQGGTKIALNNLSLIQNYSEQAMESHRGNTPTYYATQRLIYRQLQKVLEVLQQNLNDDGTPSNELRNRETNAKRVEITNLAEYLIEVLNKGKYNTQDRLNNYLQHHAPLRDQVEKELEDTVIPGVMENIVNTLCISLKGMTQESEMRKMLYDGLCIASDVFEDQTPVSEEEFKTIESGIRELTDQILETVIFHAVDEKFDFTNDKQKKGIAHFIQTLKEQSRTFTTHINRISQELTQEMPGSTLVSKISSMIEHSTRYNRDRVDAQGKIEGSQVFHTETKYHLNEISRSLLTHCNPLSQSLNIMKTNADEIEFHEKLLQLLLLSVGDRQSVAQVLQNQRLCAEDVTSCKTPLSALKQHLAKLRMHQCPTPLAEEMQRLYDQFSASLQKTEDLQKSENILSSALPLLTQLKEEKLGVLRSGQIDILKQIERQLCNKLNLLPIAEQKDALMGQVLALMVAQDNNAIEEAARNFITLQMQFNTSNLAEENGKLGTLRQTSEALHARLNTAIRDFSRQIDGKKAVVRHHSAELANRARELDALAQNQHEMPIWNLFIFDMQWVTENVKNLAFDRAQSKIRQLFDSLYQKHNYYGFANQVFLLPFLEKFGKQYLKNKS